MNWTLGVWLAVGVGLGILHAAGIWRASKQPTALSALTGFIRIVLVGRVLAAAAVLGGILPAAAGWATGYFAAVATVMANRFWTAQRSAT